MIKTRLGISEMHPADRHLAESEWGSRSMSNKCPTQFIHNYFIEKIKIQNTKLNNQVSVQRHRSRNNLYVEEMLLDYITIV